MDNAPPAPPVSSSPTRLLDEGGCGYPDRLDAALFRIAAVCGLASVMAFLDSTAVSVAQRTFVAEFGSSQAVVSWTIAGYMLAFAMVIPLTGWAADRFGTKRLFMGAVLAFTLASVLCAVSSNILLLITFRVFQGLGGGMLMPLSFMILTRAAGPKRLGRIVAVGAIPFLLGPIGGPILGGWLIGHYGWKWIFLINLPIGLVTTMLAAIMFPKDRPERLEALDVVGALLLSPGVAALLAGLSAIPGRESVADPHVAIPVVAGVLSIVVFVVRTRNRASYPLIDLRLFENRVVRWANVTQLGFAATFVGIGLLVPSYFQVVLHQTAMQAGMSMVAMGIGLVLTMPLAGVFTDKSGPGRLVLLGLSAIALGLGIFTFGVARNADDTSTLLAGLTVVGMGVGLTSTPLFSACVQSLAQSQIARGTTLLSVNDQVGGAMGAALMAVLLTNQVGRNAGVDNSSVHLSHAYTTVFSVAFVLAILAVIPALFLPRTLAVDGET
ncbi:DHA2 family efflux MFS transporter permease subunit [Mycobacterium sp. CBMA271]|uniref:DHA2 family efflux MFS transporter permease subunit n=1 Tax=unclassified Mycobacteroides TaxID=2618759 RepID=UPI0012DD153D|nr:MULTISPECIES: DHA2 family efflux MFS transporter permease subunit [unclassified Mycobacteroides]MUM19923.1 MFS transporter [Mycobacteroides sp. CBMA 326]MUM20092.1 DHA2 family efflux MFS transporter permease subunit [Mycobacteroides sp. CBMA 271]